VRWSTWGSLEPPVPQIRYSILLPFSDVSGQLVTLKRHIETLDASGEWEYLKRCSNPYELVFSQCQDQRVPPSVCSLRPLSRSFFKMVEILTVLDFFKRNQGLAKRKSIIRSAHVCEGPGGFIEALLHQASRHGVTVETSWAMTLKPTKPNIPGWKRAYTFLKKSPMVQIEYGEDGTGDIMLRENQKYFLDRARGKAYLFTADGGFDFSESYDTQEEEVFPLLVSSALIGLQTMVKGGDFVLKVFDTDLETTRHLILILAYCFDAWTLYKPALSRPCNGEKYFLGRGCRFVPQWVIETLADLRDAFASPDLAKPRDLLSKYPESIRAHLRNMMNEHQDHQEKAIQFAFDHQVSWNENPKAIWKQIHDSSVAWCKQFQMPLKSFTGLGLGSSQS
jgi:23S rRNA U2552 (ribose-2'-O)-methylase RlmE/FtsJ